VKALTSEQLQSRKEQALRFTRDVLGDSDRAQENENESLEDYATRREIKITNPLIRRKGIMARVKTKAELEAEIEELQAEDQELQDHLDAVADIVSPIDEGEDEGDEEDPRRRLSDDQHCRAHRPCQKRTPRNLCPGGISTFSILPVAERVLWNPYAAVS
jgi:hypothetical protein